MTAPYYADDAVTLYHGDALAVLRGLPGGSVDCCVTSPPYFGLRDYGVAGQIGAEGSPVEYVDALVAVFLRIWHDGARRWAPWPPVRRHRPQRRVPRHVAADAAGSGRADRRRGCVVTPTAELRSRGGAS